MGSRRVISVAENPWHENTVKLYKQAAVTETFSLRKVSVSESVTYRRGFGQYSPQTWVDSRKETRRNGQCGLYPMFFKVYTERWVIRWFWLGIRTGASVPSTVSSPSASWIKLTLPVVHVSTGRKAPEQLFSFIVYNFANVSPWIPPDSPLSLLVTVIFFFFLRPGVSTWRQKCPFNDIL